ncbi:MAG: hypothetical protein HOG43_07160 [Flavobacteriales bacterium]|jgi:hypothetical protein|nr:hypothetical protein [Flavobacteriales bacterium]
MPLESGTKISNLNKDYPLSTDQVSQGDNHIRLIKEVLKESFPSDIDIQIPDITGHAGNALVVNDIGDGIAWGGGGGGVPPGVICMWSGDGVPEGWWLCDGENSTPDLRGRFIMGLEPTVSTVGDTGGANEHRIQVGELPLHDDTFTFAIGAANGSAAKMGGDWSAMPTIPTYYVLAYIMKALEVTR